MIKPSSDTLLCMVADDDAPAHEVLAYYIQKVSHLMLVAHAYSALEAFSLLQKQHIDLLFIDIQMSGLNGIELLQSLRRRPSVIITSAYPEYAIDGFNQRVVDYLLKPIEFQRFLQAIERLHMRETSSAFCGTDDEIWLKDGNNLLKIKPSEICFIQSYGNYVRLHFVEQKPILVASSTKSILELLPSPPFVQAHKSYIVNLAHVLRLGAQTINAYGHDMPLGRTYKAQVMQYFAKWKDSSQV